MNKLLLLLFMLFMSMSPGFSQSKQDRPNYQLLWKISGNTLSKPSYLFGTMHVSDDRAFDFSDSVILKLMECEAFAMEVHPDSAVSKILQMVLDNSKSKTNKFKEIFSKEEYEYIDSLMKKKSGYSLEKLRSPWMAQLILEKSNNKKPNDRAFLDAYLFGLAKNNKKEILGLEEVEHQFKAFEVLSPEKLKEQLLSKINNEESSISKVAAELSLINMYHTGDIDALHKTMKELYKDSPEAYDYIITKRNLVMLENIQKKIHTHSTFFAVGAAHLPGDEGLINLLRKKGYQVSKVNSKFSGLASKYKYKQEDETWQDYEFEKAGYSIKMPIKPIPIKIDSLGLTFNVAIDLASNAVYQATYLPLGNKFNGQDSKSIFDQFEKNMKNSGKGSIGKTTKISSSGLEGREFTMNTGKDFFRTRLILRENIMYMLMVGPTSTIASSQEAKSFLDSFRKLNIKDEKWKEFKQDKGAFSIQMYGEPTVQTIEHKDENNSGTYYFNIYSTLNTPKNEAYIIRYNDFPAGIVSLNDSTYYTSTIKDVYNKMKGSSLRQKKITYLGFPAEEFTFNVGADSRVKGRTVFRGSRFFLLLTTTLIKNEEKEMDFFLNSLAFTDYIDTPFNEYVLKDLNLKLKFPSEPVLDKEDPQQMIYNSIDPNTGISYILIHKKLSKYSYYESSEEFFKQKFDEYLDETDSLLAGKDLTINGLPAYEAIISSKEINSVKKISLLLNGLDYYILLSYLPKDYISSPKQKSFFESPSPLNKTATEDIFKSKATILLQDLASSDTTIVKEAKKAINSYHFKSADLQQIYKALSIFYPDDNQGYGSVRSRLFDVAVKLNGEQSIDFIKSLYPKLPKENGRLRSYALSSLIDLKTQESTSTALDLLIQDSLRTDRHGVHIIFRSFFDSLALIPMIYPTVFKLLPFEEYQGVIFDLTKSGMEEKVFNPGEISEIEKHVNNFITTIPDSYFTFEDTDSLFYQKFSNLEYLTNLSGMITFNTIVNTFLEKATQSGYTAIMAESIGILARNNKTISKSDLEKVAADPSSRIVLYDKLESINKINLFPSKFLTRRLFGESELIGYLEYEEGTPDFVEFVSTKKVSYQGKAHEIYVFKFKYKEEPDWYVGIVGPHPLKSKEVKSSGDLTNYTFEKFNKSTLNKTIDSLLEGSEAKLAK